MAKSTVVQATQVDFFREHGYLCLQGFHPKNRMASVRNKLLDELKRLKVWAAGKSLSSSLQELPPFQQIAKLSTLVKVPGLHEALITPELLGCIARLDGRAPSAVQGMQLLLSLPHQGTWTLEGLNWHVDVTAQPPDRLPGIQAFVLIDDVAPRGGATLALAGAHRLHARQAVSAPSLREVLRTSGNLEADLRKMGVTILEMSGRAGDVFLMDMRLLHTPSINATKNVRMMATARFFLP
ncbi:MAG: phytanoyl-CoA dioxygenase family protein [Pseudomonadota bacterium]